MTVATKLSDLNLICPCWRRFTSYMYVANDAARRAIGNM